VLVYSGLIGGPGNETGQGIALDDDGNVYITGTTDSSAAIFPETTGPSLALDSRGSNVFVAKMKADGSGLVYASYLGGKGKSSGQAVAVDHKGNAYVIGQTNSTEFPTANPVQRTLGGTIDTFMVKLGATGSALNYSPYLG